MDAKVLQALKRFICIDYAVRFPERSSVYYFSKQLNVDVEKINHAIVKLKDDGILEFNKDTKAYEYVMDRDPDTMAIVKQYLLPGGAHDHLY